MKDLIKMGVHVPRLHLRTMLRRNMVECELTVTVINKENNRMSMRRSRYFMLQLTTEMVEATGRQLTTSERNNVLNNEKYISDYEMSDEE